MQLLTLGVLVARRHGTVAARGDSLLRPLLQVPALWAALVGLVLNGSGVEPPTLIESLLRLLGDAVSPLMLIALGLGLRWLGLAPRLLLRVFPVVLIQLVLMPLLVWALASVSGLDARLLAPVVAARKGEHAQLIGCQPVGLEENRLVFRGISSPVDLRLHARRLYGLHRH